MRYAYAHACPDDELMMSPVTMELGRGGGACVEALMLAIQNWGPQA